jgi:3-methyladenine DNA glycosylase/8-oxoguanine DNA glycosylase
MNRSTNFVDWMELVNEFEQKYPQDSVWFDMYPFTAPYKPLRKPMDFFCEAIAEQGWKMDRAVEMHNKMKSLLNSIDCYDWNPIIIFSLSDSQLKEVGYSRPKVETIRNLAHFWIEHSLDDVKLLSDKDIIELLLPIKGIGMWTIKYWLQTQLHRRVLFIEDRLPRIGLQFILNLEKVPTISQAEKIVKKRWGEFAFLGVMICTQVGHFRHYHKSYF